MRRNARGRHALSQETRKQSSFSLLLLDTPVMPLSLLLTTLYVRITIELDSISKRFITRLCNKRAIVHEATVYHSNQSSVGVMTSA